MTPTKLSIEQIYQAARQAGFTPDQATTWTAIALAESGGDPSAVNPVGEHSVGLWQVNLAVHANRWGDLTDPYANARAAYEISHGGTDMRPWTVTHASNAGTARDYRSYLDDVAQVTGYTGDPRGVQGYGAPLPEPLPPSGPDDLVAPAAFGTGGPAVDLLTDPGSALDGDADGLTDAFERLVGSDPALADTDADGLADAYETVVSRTSTTDTDTDDDALSDSDEVALGTSGTAWDTDADGASDGAEARFGADPLVAEEGRLPPSPAPPAPPPPAPVQPVGWTDAGTTLGTVTGAGGVPLAGDGTVAGSFVQEALAQEGDRYVFGAEASLSDEDPDAFDCSELTQWAADQVGVTIPDGAMYQYLDLKDRQRTMDVEEALRTPGALLFYFSEEPVAGGGRPSGAHVAISLGDGRTVEARGSAYGVMVVDAEDNVGRFNYAGVVPELAGGSAGDLQALVAGSPLVGVAGDGTAADPDADDDGLSDAYEQLLGFDPADPDTDDDGVGDAEQVLGGPRLLTEDEVRAALDAQGLEELGDLDADGLSNRYELRHRLDARSADTDADGLTDSTEVALGTDPTLLDSDHDGISDPMEVELGTDPLTAGDPTAGWGYAAPEEPPSGGLAEPVGAVDDGGLD